MPRVQVVNVRGLRTAEQRSGVVYVGRAFAGWPGHRLGNPFPLKKDAGSDERLTCLQRYKEWLLSRPSLAADLAALWDECRQGELPLGCWCDPQPCHAHILKALLNNRFVPKETDAT